MEVRTFLPTTGNEVYSIDLDEESNIKNEPIIILDEIMEEMDQKTLSGQEASDHSNSTSDLSRRETVKEDRVVCHLCKKVYKNKSSLATHLRAKHKLCGNRRAKMPCLEVGCGFRASRIARLISHLIKAHKMKFQCEKVKFQNKDGKTF